jgi:hypothetical protein
MFYKYEKYLAELFYVKYLSLVLCEVSVMTNIFKRTTSNYLLVIYIGCIIFHTIDWVCGTVGEGCLSTLYEVCRESAF